MVLTQYGSNSNLFGIEEITEVTREYNPIFPELETGYG